MGNFTQIAFQIFTFCLNIPPIKNFTDYEKSKKDRKNNS